MEGCGLMWAGFSLEAEKCSGWAERLLLNLPNEVLGQQHPRSRNPPPAVTAAATSATEGPVDTPTTVSLNVSDLDAKQ